MAAEITINQPLGAGAGVADKARQDIWLDTEVELVSSGDGSVWLWELIDQPLGSTATLTDEETALATFTPDKVGTYRIRLTVDESEYVVRVARCRYDSAGVLTQRGWALPAIDEQLGEANYDTNERHWAEVWETIMEDIRLNGLSTGITLGGDLADWDPAADTEQRVVGLNTIPLPVATPDHGDILQAQAPVMLSQFPFDITSDGTRVWVGDTQSPDSADYGGLAGVVFDEEHISTRYEYDEDGLGDGSNITIWSVVYLDGYIYATGFVSGILPVLLQIDPSDGSILSGELMAGMAYVRTDGTYLYLLIPHGAKNETVFYWVDPADLSTQTAIDANPSPYAQAGFVDFAYDDVLGKVWLVANNSGYLLRVDGTTHAIDFAVTTVDQPTAIEYGAGYLWVADDSEVYDGYYTYGYSYYGGTPEVKVVDPTDGSVVATVTDGYGLLKGVLRSAYDSVNGKLWVVCDEDAYFGDSSAGPRLIRIDTATQTVDGWCLLDTQFNMAITVAGGYVWVVDSPGGDPPTGGLGPLPPPFTILKIDPSLVDYQNPDLFLGDPVTPADAIVARITSGPLAYVFVKQNQELTITATDDYDIQNADAVIVCMEYVDVNLPQTPVIGQRHTIVDGAGNAGSSDIDIYYWDPDYYGGDYLYLTVINTAYGSKTFVYSSVGWVEV